MHMQAHIALGQITAGDKDHKTAYSMEDAFVDRDIPTLDKNVCVRCLLQDTHAYTHTHTHTHRRTATSSRTFAKACADSHVMRGRFAEQSQRRNRRAARGGVRRTKKKK